MRRLWLTREEEKGYYYGFSNEALWPLCQVCYARPQFSSAHWEVYRQVNRKFADVILSVGHHYGLSLAYLLKSGRLIVKIIYRSTKGQGYKETSY